ncbi:MAG TPA: hypothetical protein DDX19_05105 [Rhodopirellula baltica]|uniref:Uncharacterized protein n=1 Tax=Rhodopirellula baltica (strain DSM 10527 / NCIMB 13988 / SH1) TaxID=243090 RepID=Q7UDZ6_RHOBA|nr:hypothetical protein RB11678 [Rhodopirellula baltica SH 1]HBE62140.1 hypothetical protein [Rhodopirellula baltica]
MFFGGWFTLGTNLRQVGFGCRHSRCSVRPTWHAQQRLTCDPSVGRTAASAEFRQSVGTI